MGPLGKHIPEEKALSEKKQKAYQKMKNYKKSIVSTLRIHIL